MRTCLDCGAPMEMQRVTLNDYEGIQGLSVEGVEEWRCPACGYGEHSFPRAMELHRRIAADLAAHPAPLSGAALRFLRGAAGLSEEAFAVWAGHPVERVQQWEQGDPAAPEAVQVALRQRVLAALPHNRRMILAPDGWQIAA